MSFWQSSAAPLYSKDEDRICSVYKNAGILFGNDMVTIFNQVDVITWSQRAYECESSAISVTNGDL